jgi:hypothetical protein
VILPITAWAARSVNKITQAAQDALTGRRYGAFTGRSGGGVEVSATTVSLVLTEFAAVVNATKNIAAGTDALVLTEQTASVKLNVSVNGTTDALVLTENAANVNAAINVSSGFDALVITENQVSVKLNVAVSASTDALVLTEFTADVQVGADVNVAAAIVNLILTERAATVNAAVNVSAATDTLTVTVYAATVDVAATPVEATSTSGGYEHHPWKHKKRKRYEIEPEAEIVIERVVAAIAAPDTTQHDLELALRLVLQQQDILYRAIYLQMAMDALEQIRQEHEAAMEEEAAIFLLFAA